MTSPLLSASSLTLKIADKLLCDGLSFEIERGQSWGLLGRNGAGKTTLLHCLMGLHPADSGSVRVKGKDLGILPRRELARCFGMLFQESMSNLPATVLETVMLGRHPHQSSLFFDSALDTKFALEALEAFDLGYFAQRKLNSLSGGEQQRLALAMLYTQRPDLYLLDEPSNHLDVGFQVRLLSRFAHLVGNDNASILMATHDINLAARFCDHVVLLMDDGTHRVGNTDEILNEENLSRAFACRVRKAKEGHLALFYPELSGQE